MVIAFLNWCVKTGHLCLRIPSPSCRSSMRRVIEQNSPGAQRTRAAEAAARGRKAWYLMALWAQAVGAESNHVKRGRTRARPFDRASGQESRKEMRAVARYARQDSNLCGLG